MVIQAGDSAVVAIQNHQTFVCLQIPAPARQRIPATGEEPVILPAIFPNATVINRGHVGRPPPSPPFPHLMLESKLPVITRCLSSQSSTDRMLPT